MKQRLILAIRIWAIANAFSSIGLILFTIGFLKGRAPFFIPLQLAIIAGSLPIAGLLFLLFPWLARKSGSTDGFFWHSFLLCMICIAIYCLAAFLGVYVIVGNKAIYEVREDIIILSIILVVISFITLLICKKHLSQYYFDKYSFNKSNQLSNMETTNKPEVIYENQTGNSNRILTKGIITVILIGVMMIPTIFIDNLVSERQARQASVVKEVNSRWADAQTITGPYIYLPYTTVSKDATGKLLENKEHLILLPDDKKVSGQIEHEIRTRSIYKVLLYHANISDAGQFNFKLPDEINPESVQWKDTKICFGISDFKGIEERVVVQFKGTDYELSPGLPDNEINDKGLSVSIPLSQTDSAKPLSYSIKLKIKGSEQLHFVPLGGNSEFTLSSTWPNPSFDGNNIPSTRQVSDSGFSARWVFNKANLPFGTVLNHFKFEEQSLAFGVTMVQPADQYAKTNRSIKYAILIIGLTFSLFFIVELMQKKPVHPVQYVLIGLGLIIFYSLLLGISEFIPFDYAYLIAAVSTILLIGLYARGHFQNWKSAGIFGGILTLLYGFIFILIRLEDTALLVGSIGLFIILAITMYASKKVNWYGSGQQGVEGLV